MALIACSSRSAQSDVSSQLQGNLRALREVSESRETSEQPLHIALEPTQALGSMEGISRHLLDNEQWVGDSVGEPPENAVLACEHIAYLQSSSIKAHTVAIRIWGTVEHLRLRFRTMVSWSQQRP